MSLPRFFMTEGAELSSLQPGDSLSLPDEFYHHAARVLRLSVGERLVLADGQGLSAVCELTAISAAEISLRVETLECDESERKYRIHLWQALPKAAKIETIIEKSVELGVHYVHPFISRRCMVQKAELKAAKTERWRKIAGAAAAQSGRAFLPQVADLCDLAAVLKDWAEALRGGRSLLFVAWEEEQDVSLREFIQGYDFAACPVDNVHFVVGPEGGLSLEEVELLRALGAQSVSLGTHILRTETAGPAILAMLAVLLP